jgi:hypothetical protein
MSKVIQYVSQVNFMSAMCEPPMCISQCAEPSQEIGTFDILIEQRSRLPMRRQPLLQRSASRRRWQRMSSPPRR